ncbi:MAG: single-stranded DNA-binding protein [Clostridiales bacterium]|nr:single-stranded DNA-binding protein [Clostridiales bacterium]
MNKVILVGNLTRDPEPYTTQGGVNRCNFTIAVQRRFANQQGVREADFIPCVAWRAQADFITRYFTKGKKIGVVGTLQTRSYDAQDGTKRYVTEVVVDEAEFVTPMGEGERRENAEPYPRSDAGAAAPAQQPSQMEEADDDELPF